MVASAAPRGVHQDEPRSARFGVSSCGGRELDPDPGDGRLDPAQILVLAFDPQVAVPAGAKVDSLHDRAHEGEVTGVELAG